MADLVIVKGGDNKLHGLGEKGERQYAKFRSAVAKLEPGETLRFSYSLPRSPQHHRFFFAKLQALFDMQEQFEDVDALRLWLTVGAGECDFVPGPSGKMVALPRSIAWHRMEQAEFEELFRKINEFLWTPAARVFLWPHLNDQQSSQMIESLSIQFS